MRKKIWRFIRSKIFKIGEGVVCPKWLAWVRYILFPIVSIRYCPNADPRYEPWNDEFCIFGVRYTGELFRSLAKDGIAEDQWFRVIKREDGVITIGCLILKRYTIGSQEGDHEIWEDPDGEYVKWEDIEL